MTVTAVRRDKSRWHTLAAAGVWLIFLWMPVSDAVSGDHSRISSMIALGAIATFVIVYLVGFGTSRLMLPELEPVRWRHRIVWWLVLAALAIVVGLSVGVVNAAMVNTYLIAAVVFSVPLRQGVPVALGILGVQTGLVMVSGAEIENTNSYFLVVLSSVIIFIIAVVAQRSTLDGAARNALTLAEERERVARDVHDLLGHSLTVINLKAEVATRAMEKDPAVARAEMDDIARLSRVALAEVRSTVTQLRHPDLAGQIRAASRALTTVGIAVTAPDPVAAQEEVRGELRSTMAWGLREAVTNVIRHANASRCEIRVEATSLEVSDDGEGVAESWSFGDGLEGLSLRAQDHGGHLSVTERSGGGTVVRMTFPNAGVVDRQRWSTVMSQWWRS